MMKWSISIPLLLSIMGIHSAVWADKLIYKPVNPSFGGHPSNGPNLLNEANAQNPYKDPSDIKAGPKTALESFSETLSSALQQNKIKELANQAVEAEIGQTFSFGTISGIVVSHNGGLAWLTTDSRTGQTSYVQITGGY